MDFPLSRRYLLIGVAGSASSGCLDRINPQGVDYTLNFAESEEKTEEKVRFDRMDLTPEQEEILSNAIEDEYSEGYVNWDDVPNREVISVEYKDFIEKISDQLDIDPPTGPHRRIERTAYYDEWYRMILTATKAPGIEI